MGMGVLGATYQVPHAFFDVFIFPAPGLRPSESLRFHFPQWPLALKSFSFIYDIQKVSYLTSSDFSVRTGTDGYGLWQLMPQSQLVTE